MKQCAAGTDLDKEMRRLILKEGFWATVTGATGNKALHRGELQISAADR